MNLRLQFWWTQTHTYACTHAYTHTHTRTHPQNTLHIKRIMGTQLYNSDGRFTNKVTTNSNSKIWYSQVYRYKYSVHIFFIIFVPHRLFKARIIEGLQGNEPQQTKGPWADVGLCTAVRRLTSARGPFAYWDTTLIWNGYINTKHNRRIVTFLTYLMKTYKWCACDTHYEPCAHTHRKSLGTLPD